MPAGTYDVRVNYIGYAPQRFEVDLSSDDVKFNVELTAGLELGEAVVTGEQQNRIEEQVQMSRMEIPIDQIKALPAIGGEVDLLKTLQLLPGVQSGGEGTSGLYVRGGSPDQNLMLLDGVPLYNVSHLFGFFSVFNADAVKSMSITKGGSRALRRASVVHFGDQHEGRQHARVSRGRQHQRDRLEAGPWKVRL